MIKYAIGFVAGLGLSFTIAAGPKDNCTEWMMDAVVYEAIIFLLADGDAEKGMNAKANVAEAARRVLRMAGPYKFEIDSTANSSNQALIKFGQSIVAEVVKMQRESLQPKVDA